MHNLYDLDVFFCYVKLNLLSSCCFCGP